MSLPYLTDSILFYVRRYSTGECIVVIFSITFHSESDDFDLSTSCR